MRFWTSFDDFTTDALAAGSVEKYRKYMARPISFVHARNKRINQATLVAPD